LKAVIAVDIGTTSLRATLYDEQGAALHREQRQNPPSYLDDGRVEQDPDSWMQHLVDALRGTAQAAARLQAPVTCIAVTAQRSSLIAVDGQGRPLHPAILWQDSRCTALAQAMAEHDALVYRKTGLKISPVFSAIKMAWLRRERPTLWAATHKLLGVQDWVLFGLTGRYVTDHSLASRTNLLDLRTRTWDPQLLDLFGVPPSMLCELVAPGATVGGLLPGLAALTGLPSGLPVVSAGGDQQCAALGLGLLAPGHAVANTGTGSYLIGHAPAPALDPLMRVSCNVSAAPGAYIVEAATLTSGSALRWLMGLLGQDADDDAALQALADAAAAVPAGSHGLLWLPHFKGAGTPHWDPAARGALLGLSLSSTRDELARALLEAIAIELRQGLDLIEPLCGAVQAVHVSGGMTRSALFNQIQADVLERPLRRFASNEATSEGAWMAACVATGLTASHAMAFERLAQRDPPTAYAPDADQFQVYRRQAARSQAVYHALAAPHLRAMAG
jgi:glycerol kinase